MIEVIDTGLLGVILVTVIYLVKKTTTLCHDVEKLKQWLNAVLAVVTWPMNRTAYVIHANVILTKCLKNKIL